MLKYILRTPLHGIFSKTIMLLEFRGRMTGRAYRTPVSYLREGDLVTAFADSPWQRNLRHVRFDARFYGVSFNADGQPIREQVERGSQHHVMLKIQLSTPTLSNTTQR